MISHRKTRRHTIIAIATIWLLVGAGLGWATWSAVRLERLEELEAHRRVADARLERALSRMEAEVAPFLYVERTRPYPQFRDYYVPTPREARYRATGADASRDIEVASPLNEFHGPDWILLHFQASESQGWSSPELPPGSELALPAGAIPAEQRDEQATPDNWLAALRERYSIFALQRLLEEALAATAAYQDRTAHRHSHGPPADAAFDSGGNADNAESVQGSAAEIARRGRRLLDLQLEMYSEDLCEPEAVALENLEAAGSPAVRPDPASGCVPTRAPIMTPVWLDLTGDGRLQLALVRAAFVENSAYCTLQGVLIDWDRLRDVLVKQIADLFPGADVVPVRSTALSDGRDLRGMMQTIPVRLVPDDPLLGVAPPRSTITPGLTVGLAVSWGATLLALVAITYGAMKYVNMVQRRMQFAAAVTHELRTPLTSFQIYCDLLDDVPADNGEKRREYLGTLRHESQRLSRLVENVLAYARVDDAPPKLQMRRVSPADMLDAAARAAAEHLRAAEKRLVVENHCPPQTRLETDPEFVTQILTNLLENASKYSRGAADPRIWLTAAIGPADTIVLEVDDAGPGVSARRRRAVFEPFRRASDDSLRRFSGVGLGLSLSRYWAQCLGGILRVKRSPRNGSHYSCFSLTLPITPRVPA